MKKHEQLGMNPSTASARLVKDILFKFISSSGEVCFKCGKPLTRETFSIEHKIPWLDSEDPTGLFFNLENIAFSHIACNISSARRTNQKYFNKEDRKEAYKKLGRESHKRNYTTEKRRAKYSRSGY